MRITVRYFLDIIERDHLKDNGEHSLGLSVPSQASKDRWHGKHCELCDIFTVILGTVSLLLL